MASYTPAAGEIAVHDKVLVAATADTITFTDDIEAVEVITDGSEAVYFRVDGGGAATVGGTHAYKCPKQTGVPQRTKARIPTLGSGTVISVVSAGTPTYSVVSQGLHPAARFLG